MKRIGVGLLGLILLVVGVYFTACGFEEEKERRATIKGHIIPGPGEPGYDPELEQQAERYFRSMATFNSAPFGMAFDAVVGSTTDRAVVERFVTQNPQNLDFKTFCLQDPDCDDSYEAYQRIDGNTVTQPGMIKSFGEWGDLGMFGGVAAAGDLFRYAVLKEQGYPEAMVVEARERVKKILYAFHVAHTISGVPGVLVRGLRHLDFPPKEGPLIPLFDAEGNPLPKVKTGVMRPDNTGLYPGWAWADDTSKDQVDGWLFAMGVAWDVVAEDPDIPQYLKDWMVEDARNFGVMLRTVAPETGTDMVMRDGDGRLVTWCDVNPNVISFSGCPGATSPVPLNSFNAIMGLGFVKVLYHITGDEELREFYYDDLIGKRHWDDFISQALIPMVDTGYSTNYSNVNMAFIAYYNALRYEADPVIRKKLQWSLEHVLWDNGGDRQPSEIHQTFFDVIYDGLRRGGHRSEVIRLGIQTLKEFPQPLVWGGPTINCDAEEIAQGWCRAEKDPEYIIYLPPPQFRFGGHGNSLVAEEVIPRRYRHNSNFDWRSDPFEPNAGWGNSLFLMHEGDWLAAYWMGRYLRAGTAEDRNVSPIARKPVPPEAPNNLVARAVSESQINLSWHDATNKEREFVIERKGPGQEFTELARVGMNQTSYSDLGLPANTTFQYRVVAVNKTGYSPYSNVASATTYPAATTAPAGATALVATALDYSRIKLTWQDNSNNEVGFKILREDIGALALVPANVTEFIDSGLEDNTTYRYLVIAYNSKGEAWPSNYAQATTPKLPGIFLIQPDVLFQVPIDLGAIQVGFEDPVSAGEVTVVVSDEVGPIAGEWTLDGSGTVLTFVPDPVWLTMETQYTVKVTVGTVVKEFKFLTEGALWAVDIAGGVDRAFAMNIFHSTVVEPVALADLLSGLGLEAMLLLGITDADPEAKTMNFIGALGNLSGGDPSQQDMSLPTLLFPAPANLSANPMFVLGPFDFPISIEGYEVVIQQVTLQGIFEENYHYAGKAEFQGDLDVGLIAGLIGMDPQAVCALIGTCNPCPSDPGRVECVHLYIKNIRADERAEMIVPIAMVTGKDLGGSETQHELEFTLKHPRTGEPEVGVDITLSLTNGNGILDQTTVTTGADGKATVILTDLDGGDNVVKMDIASAVPYQWVSGSLVVSFAP